MKALTKAGHNAAVALNNKVAAKSAPAQIYLRLFKHLWPEYAKHMREPLDAWSSFIMNPDNAIMFWAWVYDNHPSEWTFGR